MGDRREGRRGRWKYVNEGIKLTLRLVCFEGSVVLECNVRSIWDA